MMTDTPGPRLRSAANRPGGLRSLSFGEGRPRHGDGAVGGQRAAPKCADLLQRKERLPIGEVPFLAVTIAASPVLQTTIATEWDRSPPVGWPPIAIAALASPPPRSFPAFKAIPAPAHQSSHSACLPEPYWS